MKISSPAFSHNGFVPSDYTCDGRNVNPPLRVLDVPEHAASLTLIMDDPDAPAGTWDHWVVFNIPPGVRQIDENSEPPGTHGAGTSGNRAYSGPCPPNGEHHYFFKLYALDIRLDVPEGARTPDVKQAMEGHILEEAELMGRYVRS
jgi:Raf kinase inhibitor-like YbhB/YbcL family protein